MQELLRNAWGGWQNYTENGKYAALLLAVLLFLWLRREDCKGKSLLLYTTIMAACCILPISAAVLMKYQTPFYDYQWIWNYVPLTLVIAYGAVILLYDCRNNDCREKKGSGKNGSGKWLKWRPTVMAVAIILLIVLCGRLGQPAYDSEKGRVFLAAEDIFSELEAMAGEQEICLWAPRDIMAAARSSESDIRLIYGRNMWDAALGAYFYEDYGDIEKTLYGWMCNAEETGSCVYVAEDGSKIKGTKCMKTALKAGVNTILLPDTIQIEEIQNLSKGLGIEVQQLEGYYLFMKL